MRVAYIGNFGPEYSTENDVRKAFEHLGWEVIQLQENRFNVLEARQQVLESNLLLITSTWDDAIPLAPWLTLMKECADKGIPTATLHLDTFWSTPRNGRTWWLNPMFHTAYIFTADGDYQDKWKAYGKNHIWLPPALRFDAAHRGESRLGYECDVAFVGSNGTGYHEDVWGYRKELLHQLKNMCIRNNWRFKNPGGDDPKVNRDDDLNDFYASAKVVVGDSLCLKRANSKYWSDRVPETLGRGGNLIMPYIKELSILYNHNIPMYPWDNWLELETIIADKLKGWDYKGNVDARKFCHNLTKQYHTYVNRVQTILKEVGL